MPLGVFPGARPGSRVVLGCMVWPGASGMISAVHVYFEAYVVFLWLREIVINFRISSDLCTLKLCAVSVIRVLFWCYYVSDSFGVSQNHRLSLSCGDFKGWEVSVGKKEQNVM